MANIPFKDIENLRIELYSHDGTNYDLTKAVTSFALHENIYYPFVYGTLIFLDNAGFLGRTPIIGQEHITISAKLTNEPQLLEKGFFVAGYENVKPTGHGRASVKLTLLSFEQANDVYFMISRHMKGPNTEIIAELYDEFFGRTINTQYATPGPELQLVIPYTTPLKAIESILKNTWDGDKDFKTPLFLYETLYDKRVYLKSYKQMIDSEYTFDITPIANINVDYRNRSSGFVSPYLSAKSGRVQEYALPEGFNTYRIGANGGYKHRIHHADYSNKKIDTDSDNVKFDYRKHAPILTVDNIVDKFYNGLGNLSTEASYGSNRITTDPMIVRRYTNTLAFGAEEESAKNLLATGDQLERSAFEQYVQRHRTVYVTAMGSYAPEIEIGKNVYIDINLHIPPVKDDSENPNSQRDIINSGNYVVGGMEHRYEMKGEPHYYVNYQLMRDGMNPND